MDIKTDEWIKAPGEKHYSVYKVSALMSRL